MYLNLYNLEQLEQLFKKTLTSFNVTLNPDKSAPYHCVVEYANIVDVAKHYNQRAFAKRLQDFISQLPKPTIRLIEDKEEGILLGYRAELLAPYSLHYEEIIDFLNHEMQIVANDFAIGATEIKPFLTKYIPESLQQLITNKFVEIVIDYQEYLETKKADPFFAAYRLESELLAQLLDLLQNPIFNIDLDNEDFLILKLINIVNLHHS